MTTRRQVAIRDQVIGATQAAGIKPSVKGIAAKRVINAVNRAIDAADSIQTIFSARDGGDPATAEIANRLMANKEFVRAMIASVESILSDVKKVAAESAPTAKPAAAAAPAPDDEGVKYAGGGSGTDARLTGPYRVPDLMRDIKAQNDAVAKLAPKIGLDAAMAQVGASPLIPNWQSPVWTTEARKAYRARALSDGSAAAHIGMDVDLYKDTPEAPTPHPRSFDR